MYEIKYRDQKMMITIKEKNIKLRPDNWNVKRLKYISVINNGATPKTSVEAFWDGNIDWYTPTDFGDISLSSSKRKITLRGLNSCGTTLVPKGSCIITCRAPIGNIAILENEKAAHNQGCKSIVPSIIDFKFLYYTMLECSTHLKSMGKGTTFMELSSTDLKNIKLLNPRIDEQKKIANFLDLKTAQFDSIISKKEQLIEKLEEVKKSLISEVVTGKVKIVEGQLVKRDASEMKDSGVEWLGLIPRKWMIKKIKHVSKLNQKTLSNNESEALEIRYIDIGSVGSSGIISEVQEFEFGDAPSRARRIVSNSDVIISTVRTYLRAIAHIDSKYNNCVCSTGFAVITPNQNHLNSQFFYYMIHSQKYVDQIVSRSVGVSYPAINASEIMDINISMPKVEIQEAIVKYLGNKIGGIYSCIDMYERQIKKLKQAKKSLISEAVTGKIDLRDWEIIEEGELQ